MKTSKLHPQAHFDTPHYTAARKGSDAAREMYKTETWCYIHGFLAEFVRCVLPGDVRANSIADELLTELKDAARGWAADNSKEV